MIKNLIKINSFSIILCLSVFFTISSIYAQAVSDVELVNIDFEGNDYFSTSDLEDAITLKESPSWFSQFLDSFTSFGNPANYFDSLNIQDDINILLNLYKTNGFFKPKISAKYSIEKNGEKEASLQYIIKENEPSIIKELNLKGLGILSTLLYAELYELVDIDSTTQYSEFLVEQNNSRILGFLQDKGFMMAESSLPLVEVDTIQNRVNITIDYKLGTRFRISDISVEKSGKGEDLVSDELIKEVANISSNKFYNSSELKLAQVRLYRTNLFSSAVIAPQVQDTINSFVPVNIMTRVGLLNELSPEIILINEENVVKLGLGLSFTNKNFLGDARKLTISTSAAAQNITEFLKEASLATNNMYGYADARVSIEQPFLFGKTINTKLENFYTLQKEKNRWNANIYGSKLNLNFELPKYTYLTYLDTYFNWQRTKYIFKENYIQNVLFSYFRRKLDSETTDEEISSIVKEIYSGDAVSNNTNVVLGVSLGTNQTDDLLFPTEGYSISILVEDGNSIPLLLSSIGNYNFNQTAYYKLVFNNTLYFSFLDNIFDAFGTKLKLGNIHNYDGELINIPYNQRFTAGGSNSIRGWGANDLPVTEIVLPDNPTQNEIENLARNITPGGFFVIEGSIEGRKYLSEKIGMALFIDYGNVWNKYKNFRYDEIAVAAGFGFRYYSDFAPIRLDFGFQAYDPYDRRDFFTRLKHSPFLNTFEFQIGIGEAF
ncbi:MAG: BamA/TamA family outer membrane protein [Ignavibacteriae bacterium]|nr:BamA/TamA family outer membrane protein [Ignavibacteriota bacterium]